jgi:hypothetical protein
MTIIEQHNENRATIEEMRDEIEVLKAAGSKQVIIDIDLAEQLVAIALGVMQLKDLAADKPVKKVQR